MTQPGVYIEGLKQLRAGVKAVDAAAPRIFNRTLRESLTGSVLPKVRARTPRGRSGGLSGGSRVSVAGNTVAIVNRKPYANAIHWGREWWPNQRSPIRRHSPVEGRPFVYGALMDDRDQIERDLADGIGDALQRAVT